MDEPPGSDVSIRVTKCLVESGTVGIIQPVARIKRKEFDLRAIREIRGFVNDESPRFDRGLDGHGGRVPLECDTRRMSILVISLSAPS